MSHRRIKAIAGGRDRQSIKSEIVVESGACGQNTVGADKRTRNVPLTPADWGRPAGIGRLQPDLAARERAQSRDNPAKGAVVRRDRPAPAGKSDARREAEAVFSREKGNG